MIIPFLLMAAAAVTPPASAPRALDDLSGCWSAPGSVRGTAVTGFARGEWHLAGNYFMLQLHSGGESRPYSAAIVYGGGESPEDINSYWMDSTGGAYATTGTGHARAGEIDVDYAYPDAHYANRLSRSENGWTWTILENVPGRPARLFAEYHLSPTSCEHMSAVF